MIFGILGKFCIDIGVQIFFEIFFRDEIFSQKNKVLGNFKKFENLENFDFTKDFLIESIRKSLVKSNILRFFEIFEKHIF